MLIVNDVDEEVQKLTAALTAATMDIRVTTDTTNDYNTAIRSMVANLYDVYIVAQYLADTPLTGDDIVRRANAGGCFRPIIITTSQSDDALVEEICEDCGAAGFLNTNKDMGSRIVKRAIQYAIGHYQCLQDVKAQLIRVQKELVDVKRKLDRG